MKSNVTVERRRNVPKGTKLFDQFAMDVIRTFLQSAGRNKELALCRASSVHQ